ncbi:MAG: hypothetical protein AB8C13_01265 [Phycisphaerales bacterium]
MQSTTKRQLFLTSLLYAGLMTPVVSMNGCESSQLRNILNSPTAMELLSPLVKDAANSYIANLNSLTGMLGSLDSLSAVMEFIQRIEPTINDLKAAYSTLSSTSSEERAWLWEAFGPKLNNANSSFLNQSDALTSETSFGGLLTPVFDKIDLLQSN